MNLSQAALNQGTWITNNFCCGNTKFSVSHQHAIEMDYYFDSTAELYRANKKNQENSHLLEQYRMTFVC